MVRIYNFDESVQTLNAIAFRHYCACRPGFRSYLDPLLGFRHRCADVNECEMGTHTCDEGGGSKCWNTHGSYQCYCRPGDAECSNGIPLIFGSQFNLIKRTSFLSLHSRRRLPSRRQHLDRVRLSEVPVRQRPKGLRRELHRERRRLGNCEDIVGKEALSDGRRRIAAVG